MGAGGKGEAYRKRLYACGKGKQLAQLVIFARRRACGITHTPTPPPVAAAAGGAAAGGGGGAVSSAAAAPSTSTGGGSGPPHPVGGPLPPGAAPKAWTLEPLPPPPSHLEEILALPQIQLLVEDVQLSLKNCCRVVVVPEPPTITFAGKVGPRGLSVAKRRDNRKGPGLGPLWRPPTVTLPATATAAPISTTAAPPPPGATTPTTTAAGVSTTGTATSASNAAAAQAAAAGGLHAYVIAVTQPRSSGRGRRPSAKSLEAQQHAAAFAAAEEAAAAAAAAAQRAAAAAAAAQRRADAAAARRAAIPARIAAIPAAAGAKKPPLPRALVQPVQAPGGPPPVTWSVFTGKLSQNPHSAMLLVMFYAASAPSPLFFNLSQSLTNLPPIPTTPPPLFFQRAL